jgi:hypothetical protein
VAPTRLLLVTCLLDLLAFRVCGEEEPAKSSTFQGFSGKGRVNILGVVDHRVPANTQLYSATPDLEQPQTESK